MRLFSVLAVVVAASAVVGSAPGCSSDRKRDDRGGGGAARAGVNVPPVKLVVLVVIDQLPSWVFERRLPHFDGGFARLRRQGAYVPAAELPYANPFTAPGHASIGTGAPPSVHGVLGNSWYRRDVGRDQPAELDQDAKVFEVGPSQDGELSPDDSSSGKALQVDGIADVLRRESAGRARSVAIALKPRAAAFMIGKKPDLAIWYEAAAGGMTTTSAYVDAPPPWLTELARGRSAQRFFERTWTAPLDLLASVTQIDDDRIGEGSIHGLDNAFPHELGKSDKPARAFLHTAFADELVLDTLHVALRELALGRDEQPDLLAVSFNAHDYAGHLWGPDAWETFEIERGLDKLLGSLFDTLDRQLGANGWAVVITSDHGMTPLVDRSPHPGARRIPIADVTRIAEEAVADKLGQGPWIAKVIANNIYFTTALGKLEPDARTVALDAAIEAVSKIPSVARVGRTEQAMTECESTDALARAICRSIVPGESGELYVVPARGSLITDYTTGSHHDAPFDDNRRVPIFVMAPGLPPSVASAGTILQVAPTLAALLRIPPPPAAKEPPLFGLRPAASSTGTRTTRTPTRSAR